MPGRGRARADRLPGAEPGPRDPAMAGTGALPLHHQPARRVAQPHHHVRRDRPPLPQQPAQRLLPGRAGRAADPVRVRQAVPHGDDRHAGLLPGRPVPRRVPRLQAERRGPGRLLAAARERRGVDALLVGRERERLGLQDRRLCRLRAPPRGRQRQPHQDRRAPRRHPAPPPPAREQRPLLQAVQLLHGEAGRHRAAGNIIIPPAGRQGGSNRRCQAR